MTSHANSQGAASLPAWISRGHVPSLDGWRAVAILMVLVHHLAPNPDVPFHSFANYFVPWGPTGVSIFFVLSGFLITLLLMRESAQTGTIGLRAFDRRRIVRLLPAYLVYLLVLYILSRFGRVYLSGKDWIGALTYIMGLWPGDWSWEVGHFWSLSVEEHFYLLWPPLLCYLTFRRSVTALIACVACTPFLRLFLYQRFRADVIDCGAFSLTRLDSITVGCLLAFAVHQPSFQRSVIGLRKHATVVTCLTVVALLALPAAAQLSYRFSLMFGRTIEAVLVAVLIIATVGDEPNLIHRLLNSKVATTLGLLSYSIYIWQQLFTSLGWQPSGMPTWTLAWPTNLLLILGTAGLSYCLIERPCLRLRHGAGRILLPKTTSAPAFPELQPAKSPE